MKMKENRTEEASFSYIRPKELSLREQIKHPKGLDEIYSVISTAVQIADFLERNYYNGTVSLPIWLKVVVDRETFFSKKRISRGELLHQFGVINGKLIYAISLDSLEEGQYGILALPNERISVDEYLQNRLHPEIDFLSEHVDKRNDFERRFKIFTKIGNKMYVLESHIAIPDIKDRLEIICFCLENNLFREGNFDTRTKVLIYESGTNVEEISEAIEERGALYILSKGNQVKITAAKKNGERRPVGVLVPTNS